MKTKTTTTARKPAARKVTARKPAARKPAVSKGLASLTAKEQVKATRASADKLAAQADKGKRTLYANECMPSHKVGYGKGPQAITGPNMGALTRSVFWALGYIKVSPTGNATATKKEIAREDITALLGSSMSNRWYNTHKRIEGGKLNAKGLNMLNARSHGEPISKSGEGTTSSTTMELVKYYYERVTKGGKGKQGTPFHPIAVKVGK